MGEIWTSLLLKPMMNALMGLYFAFDNFGMAVVALTVLISVVSLPLMLPSLKSAEKMRELQPQLDKLKKKWAGDKEKLARAQMDFYKEKGINPAGGCLPQILRLVVLIAMYSVFQKVMSAQTGGDFGPVKELLYSVFQLPEGFQINLKFLGMDLAKPDLWHLGKIPLPGILLSGAAAAQFLSGKMMMPATSKKEEGKKEGEGGDMMTMMQNQSLYMMPLMTLLFGYTFPAGLILYWLTMSLVMAGQQALLKKK